MADERLAGAYTVSDDRERLDLEVIWRFLSTAAYWNRWRRRSDVEAQVRGAWRVVGGYTADGSMVGFARALSDGVALAYLADVFVLPEHRSRGLARRMLRVMIDDGPGADFRWLAHTRDAHVMYAGFGFRPADRTLLERPGERGAIEP